MASTSSSSSSGSEYHGPWEYDVFLCFRGETRTSFTSHVMAALSEKKIRTFIDTMLGKGNSITDLLSVLKRSALSVIIFSERFAESTWCLDEVATISRSMKEFGHRVLPVFYNVDPSEVDGETGSYAAMIESQDGSKYPPSVKMKWRSALKEVVDKAGLTSCEIRHDSQLIKAIVDNVWKELVDMSPRLKPKNLIGMDSRVWEVERLLDMNRSDDIRVVGLWGMSGMGKTTLARALYQRFTNFLKEDTDINAKWKGRPDNLEGLQKELYATLLSEQDQNITSGDLETSYRRARLSRLKVFIVLDDVEYWSQLEQLLLGDVLNLTKLFALGSRIIVTTRNRKVLESAMARIYHVEKLNPQESLRLFSLYSFRREVPPEDRRYQSITAVGYCQGYPLALRVLGCALFRKSKSYWQSYLDGLRKTGKQEIHGVLRKSYDELARDEKPMFLDIACFFRRNYSKSNLIKMMESSYYSAYSRVEDLIDKALLICDQSSDHEGSNDDVGGQIIEVHDLLHQMAWNIIGEEPELANRTRLENPNDIHKLLTTRKGERATEGINLDLSKAEEMHLGSDVFVGMDRLRLLKFTLPDSSSSPGEALTSKIHIPDSGLDSLPPELRMFWWDGFPSSLLPSKFSPHNIVQIRIRHSPLTQCWDGVQDFVNLRWFDLSYCKNLTIVPDLSKATHLESLKLAGCKSIVELPSFVEYLDKLITLDVGACENLEILPPKLGSKHLKHVIISNCRKIKQCPELVSNWDNLDLHGTPITTLPSSIYSVKQAQTLYLHGQSITTFPQFSPTLKGFYLCHTAIEKLPHQRPSDSSKYNLPRIAQLQLIENSKLVKFSRNIWNIVTTELIIIGSPMLEMLPEIPENPTARDLRVLVVEQCKTFKRLPSSINILKSLEVLSLTGAAIRLMPLCIQDLEQLRTLDMSHCKSLESLPSTISMLGRLSQIYLVGCLSLRSLPELPQSVKTLAAGNCKSLQAVSSSNFRKLHFRHLSFVGCNQLDEKLLGQLMAKLPRHDATSLQSPYVGRVGERHPTTVLYPGSELPEWFAYKSMGDSVTFPLPKNSKRLKGISFAAVYALGASNDKDEDIHLHMKCDCFIKPAGSHGCASDDVGVVEKWIVCMSNFHDCVSTDHVFLWSDHKPEPTLSSSGENDEYEGGEAWYVKYSGMDLSFRFSTDVKRGDIKHCKIKRCGVSLAFHTVGNL
ncbi:Disease resistance-like protein DSC1 [Linum perenne]